MESPKKFFPLTRGEAGKGFSSVPCQQRLVVEQLLITVRGEALSQVFCGGLSAVRSYPILHIVSWGDEEGYISQPKFWITDPHPPPQFETFLGMFLPYRHVGQLSVLKGKALTLQSYTAISQHAYNGKWGLFSAHYLSWFYLVFTRKDTSLAGKTFLKLFFRYNTIGILYNI